MTPLVLSMITILYFGVLFGAFVLVGYVLYKSYVNSRQVITSTQDEPSNTNTDGENLGAIINHSETIRNFLAEPKSIDSTKELKYLLSIILEQARGLLGGKGASLLRRDPTTNDLVMVAETRSELVGKIEKYGVGMSGLVVQGEPYIIVDDYADWPLRNEMYDKRTYRAIVLVPLKWGDRVLGTLSVDDDPPEERPRFTKKDAQLLIVFANTVAFVLRISELGILTAKRKKDFSFDFSDTKELIPLVYELKGNGSSENH